MKSYLRMKAELKKTVLKPGRLLGMNTYLLINTTCLQHLTGLQNPQKPWKPIKVLTCCWVSFPVPCIIQKIPMLLKRGCLENLLRTAGPYFTLLSGGEFEVLRPGGCAGDMVVLLSEVLKLEGCEGSPHMGWQKQEQGVHVGILQLVLICFDEGSDQQLVVAVVFKLETEIVFISIQKEGTFEFQDIIA